MILQFLKDVAKNVQDEPTEEYTATRSATRKAQETNKESIQEGDKVNVTYPNLKNKTYRGGVTSVLKEKRQS